MYELRYYQKEARDAIFNYFLTKNGNPLIAMPTGTGKSLVIADFIRAALKNWPTLRIMMLTHVKELIVQNKEKLTSLYPTLPVGVYSASMGKRDTHTSVVMGGVQSVARALDKDGRSFGVINLMLIDECHLLSPKDTTQYQKTISKLKELNPNLKVIGFTATPYRMRVGSIVEGDGLFDDIAYDLCSMENFNKLLLEGYLSPLIPKRPELTIDVSDVSIVKGEYDAKEVAEVVDTQENTFKAVQEIVKYGWNRRSWLVFATSIAHCENIVGMLQTFGVDAAASHSKLSKDENDRVIADFKAGHIRCLVNMNKLTTGFDHPGIDLIGMLRPTRSTVLWVQMLGRGLRPAPGKENCVALDFVGNTERLGPINDPVIPLKPGDKKKPGEAPVKVCENCGMYNHSTARVCGSCDQPFPIRDKIKTTASSLELVRTFDTSIELPFEMPTIIEYDVHSVTYQKHKKKGTASALPTMRVTYNCGIVTSFSEWVCFEHVGIPRRRAESWWIRRCGKTATPQTVDEALSLRALMREPKKVRVSVSKNKNILPEVVGVDF
jgi:DNA repair protein RadD